MINDLNSIKIFYLEAFQKFDDKRTVPPILIEFYAYVGLRHTIRIREGQVFVRLSDLSKNAPLAVHKSLAFILVAKLLKRRVPKLHAEAYKNYALHPQLSEHLQTARRTRGRKITTSPRGANYDLEDIFSRLNKKYFKNEIEKPVLSWSRTKTRRVFGHQDATHDTIIISKTLDDARVPQFVVEFVLYHELLHIKHPTKIVNGKRRIHSTAFRRDEQLFPNYQEAEKWLEKLAQVKSKRG